MSQTLARQAGWLKQHTALHENILTGLLFEALDYMPPEEAGRALALLLPDPTSFDDLHLRHLELWPRHAEAGNIPDLVAHCLRAGAPFRLILEVKHRGGALRAGQALEQWRRFGPNAGNDGRHVILCDDYGRQREALAGDDEHIEAAADRERWSSRRSVLLWSMLAARVAEYGRSGDAPSQRWSRHAAAALRRLGHVPFEGFTALRDKRPPPASPAQIFFRNVPRRLRWPTAGPRFEAPIFWAD